VLFCGTRRKEFAEFDEKSATPPIVFFSMGRVRESWICIEIMSGMVILTAETDIHWYPWIISSAANKKL
jgi:hypothetical protein